jgi:hypothetical protein
MRIRTDVGCGVIMGPEKSTLMFLHHSYIRIYRLFFFIIPSLTGPSPLRKSVDLQPRHTFIESLANPKLLVESLGLGLPAQELF